MNSLQILLALITLIAAVAGVIWGLKRYRYLKYARIKTRLRYQTSGDENFEEDFRSELPGGSSRLVGHRDPEDINTVNNRIREQAEANKPKLRSPSEQGALDLGAEQDQGKDPHIPVLLDPTEEVGSPAPVEEEPLEAITAEEPEPELEAEPEPEPEAEPEPEPEAEAEAEAEAEPLAAEQEEVDHSILFSDPETTEKHPRGHERIAPVEQNVEPDVTEEESEAVELQASSIDEEVLEPEQAPEQAPAAPDEVIIINLMCTEHGEEFLGTELKSALESQGLKHGNMDIFHFDTGTGSETIQFGAANILNPGTFPAEKLEYFYTPGICFFMTMTSGVSNLQAFNQLLSAARGVASMLGGELKDQERNYLTHQRVEEIRTRMGDFQRENLPG